MSTYTRREFLKGLAGSLGVVASIPLLGFKEQEDFSELDQMAIEAVKNHYVDEYKETSVSCTLTKDILMDAAKDLKVDTRGYYKLTVHPDIQHYWPTEVVSAEKLRETFPFKND